MDTKAIAYKEGLYLDYTPAGAVTAGQPVDLGGIAGIAAADIAAGVKGSVQVEGVIKVQKAQVAGNVGDPVGWDNDGDPYGLTAGTGAATTLLTNANFILGSLVVAAAAIDSYAYVVLNKILADKPVFRGMTFETIAVDKTLDIQDGGKAFIVTVDAKTFTLPATAAGLGPMAFINGGVDAAVAINISPNANDKIMGPDIAGADNKDLINTKATAKHWDYVILRPDVAGAGWSIDAIRGTWETEG
jgi:predicted RecA/RadA family phage recombinase